MQPEATLGRGYAAGRSLAELLACPPDISELLNSTSHYFEFREGDVVFRQGTHCRGLYIVVSGDLLRRAERLDARLVLGTVRAGELVELASVLGDGRHTYTLTAQSPSSLMLLSFNSLQQAFSAYAPLRMRLLEELAREVSRSYGACCATRLAGVRRRASGAHSLEG